jgi:integrase
MAYAQELHDKTIEHNYSLKDVKNWLKQRLITEFDADRLGYSCHAKELWLAFTDYQATWEVSPKEEQARQARCQRILDILGEDSRIDHLRHSDGLRLRKELKEQGLKTATIQKVLQDARRMLGLQVADGIIEFNPFGEVKAGHIPRDEVLAPHSLTLEEVGNALKKAAESKLLKGQIGFVLLLLLGTGMRRGEALAARWEWIDWDRRMLSLPGEATKTGKPRKIGLGQKLYYELLVRRQEEGFILPRFAPWSISRAIRELLEKCDIKARLHDLRHTYTTLLQTSGAKPIETMARTGHSNMKMLSHYSHGETDEILEDNLDFLKMPGWSNNGHANDKPA